MCFKADQQDKLEPFAVSGGLISYYNGDTTGMAYWAKAVDAALADRDAEIERLRKDLVWAVRKGVMVGHDECVRPCIWFDVHRGVEYDGTPESICLAVREARDGS